MLSLQVVIIKKTILSRGVMKQDQYWRTLGLEPDASFDEVQTAYKELMQIWHPDKFPHSEKLRERAEEQAKKINEAFYELESTIGQTNDLAARTKRSRSLAAYRAKREKTVSRTRMLLFVGLSLVAVIATTGVPASTSGNTVRSFTPFRPMVSETVVVGTTVTIGKRANLPKLVRAAMDCNMTSMKANLRNNANPNVEDPAGVSALAWAARTNCLAGAELLIQHGANLNARSGNGFTPVVWAETHNHRDMVKRLQQAGANTSASFWSKS